MKRISTNKDIRWFAGAMAELACVCSSSTGRAVCIEINNLKRVAIDRVFYINQEDDQFEQEAIGTNICALADDGMPDPKLIKVFTKDKNKVIGEIKSVLLDYWELDRPSSFRVTPTMVHNNSLI